MSDYLVTVNSSAIVPNGGLLTLNLYKISSSIVEAYKTYNDSTGYFEAPTVMNWTQPKGEIIVIQKPSNALEVDIRVDRAIYAPGDLVSYEVRVTDRRTKKIVNNKDVLVSVVATDESVFNKIEERKQPASLGAAVYLENEVSKISNELYYSN
jgi:hypothetical protein